MEPMELGDQYQLPQLKRPLIQRHTDSGLSILRVCQGAIDGYDFKFLLISLRIYVYN